MLVFSSAVQCWWARLFRRAIHDIMLEDLDHSCHRVFNILMFGTNTHRMCPTGTWQHTFFWTKLCQLLEPDFHCWMFLFKILICFFQIGKNYKFLFSFTTYFYSFYRDSLLNLAFVCSHLENVRSPILWQQFYCADVSQTGDLVLKALHSLSPNFFHAWSCILSNEILLRFFVCFMILVRLWK